MANDARTCDVEIDEELVAGLIARQFPQWSDRTVRAIVPGGWDNRSFRLGEDMLVRLPSAGCYAAQVEKEQRWLPVLAPMLPRPIPSPIAMGEPGSGYPWRWAILGWLDGEPACRDNVADIAQLARDLAEFLRALWRADANEGPPPGRHNFFRGGAVATYDREVREAIAGLAGRIDSGLATTVWQQALASTWEHPAVWVHGDVSESNLLVRDGRLAAVIDFGSSGVGDPACDLAMAWTFFARSEREIFRRGVELDTATWRRARGWSLWKALSLMHREDGPEWAVRDSWRVFRELLDDVGVGALPEAS